MKQPFSHTSSRGVTYYLFSKDVTLRAGRKVRIYFFNRKHRAYSGFSATPEPELPAGYRVRENPRNGFLTVQRINTDGGDPE